MNEVAVLSNWSPSIPRSRASLIENLAKQITFTLIIHYLSVARVILNMLLMMILTLNFVHDNEERTPLLFR